MVCRKLDKLDNGMQMQGRQLVRHLVFIDRIEKLMFVETNENRKTGNHRNRKRSVVTRMLRVVLPVLAVSALILGTQQVYAQQAGSAGSASEKVVEPNQVPGIPSESLSDYPAVGKRAGVWNDGLAALWDLHVLDHYKYFGPPQRAEGYAPEQPINFSHIVHVQQNKMECQYCHWNVSKGSYAALPDVDTCMGCHKIVGGRDEASTAEIQKLRDIYAKGQPIEWLKVHVMPDHYKFNHKRHVKGGVACHECHGQVPEMAKVERVSSMKMGWCLDCHRMRGASIDCATCHY
jgi:hypothetical protein